MTEHASPRLSLIQAMQGSSPGDTVGPVPTGELADRPIRELVSVANMVDGPQSYNATVYGSIALREAMVRYYDGDVDRALVALEDCSNEEVFTRLYEMAETAGLDDRPCPGDAH